MNARIANITIELQSILARLVPDGHPAFQGNSFVMEFPCNDPKCDRLHRFSGNEVTVLMHFAEMFMSQMPGARGITILTMDEHIKTIEEEEAAELLGGAEFTEALVDELSVGDFSDIEARVMAHYAKTGQHPLGTRFIDIDVETQPGILTGDPIFVVVPKRRR